MDSNSWVEAEVNFFRRENYADEITWITCKTEQNLERWKIWTHFSSFESGKVVEKLIRLPALCNFKLRSCAAFESRVHGNCTKCRCIQILLSDWYSIDMIIGTCWRRIANHWYTCFLFIDQYLLSFDSHTCHRWQIWIASLIVKSFLKKGATCQIQECMKSRWEYDFLFVIFFATSVWRFSQGQPRSGRFSQGQDDATKGHELRRFAALTLTPPPTLNLTRPTLL